MKLLIADLDGTLVESWGTTPLPGVEERLAEVCAQGAEVVVVTNQGGIGYRYAYETWNLPEKAARYPDLTQVLTRLQSIAETLPISRLYTCLHHGRDGWPIPAEWEDGRIERHENVMRTGRLDRRKPAPGGYRRWQT